MTAPLTQPPASFLATPGLGAVTPPSCAIPRLPPTSKRGPAASARKRGLRAPYSTGGGRPPRWIHSAGRDLAWRKGGAEASKCLGGTGPWERRIRTIEVLTPRGVDARASLGACTPVPRPIQRRRPRSGLHFALLQPPSALGASQHGLTCRPTTRRIQRRGGQLALRAFLHPAPLFPLACVDQNEQDGRQTGGPCVRVAGSAFPAPPLPPLAVLRPCRLHCRPWIPAPSGQFPGPSTDQNQQHGRQTGGPCARVAGSAFPAGLLPPPAILQRLLRGFVSSFGGLSLSRPLLPTFASPAVSDSRPEFAFRGGGRRLRPFLGAAPFSSASPASPRRRSIPAPWPLIQALALLSERAHGSAWMPGSLRPGSSSSFRRLICALHPFAVAGLECPVP